MTQQTPRSAHPEANTRLSAHTSHSNAYLHKAVVAALALPRGAGAHHLRYLGPVLTIQFHRLPVVITSSAAAPAARERVRRETARSSQRSTEEQLHNAYHAQHNCCSTETISMSVTNKELPQQQQQQQASWMPLRALAVRPLLLQFMRQLCDSSTNHRAAA